MTAEQRAELLKRVTRDDLSEKISYRECEKIAKELNLTLEQVGLFQDVGLISLFICLEI
jgi:general transcription factor 3C polypeptide 1